MLARGLAALAAALTAPAALADLPVEIEVFHINPYHLGPIPVNMDTGDALGDLFFDLMEVIMNPLVCADQSSSHWGFTCNNQEASGPDLVANQLKLRVSGEYSGYAMCNIGGPNNTDPFGKYCKAETYCCYCTDMHWKAGVNGPFPMPTKPCNATVGREPSSEFPMMRDMCSDDAPEYLCWMGKLGKKIAGQQGNWYSTLDYGYCPHHPDLPSNCTWEVASVEKIVNKTCHEESFFGSVENYNSTCFKGCGAVRNVTSECWIRCFYEAVLGPEAAVPGGTVAGMPLDQLVEAWSAPFKSEDVAKGGCPSLPVPSSAQAAVGRPVSRRPKRERAVVV